MRVAVKYFMRKFRLPNFRLSKKVRRGMYKERNENVGWEKLGAIHIITAFGHCMKTKCG